MAAIFKRRPGRNEPYVIQYVDHLGKRRTRKGFTDKGLTEELAGKLESEARLRSTGMIDPSQERIAQQRATSIELHVTAFQESLSDNTPKYVKQTSGRIRKIVTGCGFVSLACFETEPVQAFLRRLRKEEGLGHRTCNHYLQAIDAFCNWCVATKRLAANPLAGMERLNAAMDVRHPRRALTAEEVAKLVSSARSSGVAIQCYSGEERARIYLISYLSGLRRGEIASLKPLSFDLKSPTPTLTVEAACSKHRRKDVLPLHPDLSAMLPAWLRGHPRNAKLFPGLEKRRTWLMVKRDLERVGIPYRNDEGIADFHAAGRHSHITELLRSGVSLPEARELARHSDVNMTMRYTHIGLQDQAEAIAHLPSAVSADQKLVSEPAIEPNPPLPEGTPKEAALQMRCRFCSATGHWGSTVVNEASDQKRLNPCESKGLGNESRQLSKTGKVEAAGIEPACRDRWTQTSTCVVVEFRFAERSASSTRLFSR
ncbi:Tyrosine recombinase XerC [Adhaeretor mobilis]|uniref:Tyrosine recombinase XerC n=1 Tax=Adhaeretor mobilis TaxID=1930276 RepID=A0A517MQD2_9BACT|nr:Tyrosine recombinase XerC [Adhaeretor mobilis]